MISLKKFDFVFLRSTIEFEYVFTFKNYFPFIYVFVLCTENDKTKH